MHQKFVYVEYLVMSPVYNFFLSTAVVSLGSVCLQGALRSIRTKTNLRRQIALQVMHVRMCCYHSDSCTSLINFNEFYLGYNFRYVLLCLNNLKLFELYINNTLNMTLRNHIIN